MKLAAARAVWREVVVVNAGGTINMDAGAGAAPGDGVARLFARLGDGFDRSRLRLRSPFARPPDSSNVGPAEWAALVDELRRIEADKAAAADALAAAGEALAHRGGVVVAHGTDTMQVTSMVVALELAGPGLRVPVVFTGSHSPPDAPGSDAVANLAKAIFAASHRPRVAPHNLPPGVYVLLGEDVHLASRLTKVRSSPDAEGRYFFSFPGPVAQMTSKDFAVKLDQHLLDSLDARRPDAPARSGPWGYVEHAFIDAFVDPAALDDLGARVRAARERAPGRRAGVVVQGDFSAHAQRDRLVAGLRSLAEAGVVVALGSRKAFSVVTPHTVRPSTLPIALLPRSLSHGCARTKLAWLLGTEAPTARMPALLASSLVGEVFETHSLPTWIKYETWPDQHAGVAAQPAWPGLPPQVVADHAARLLAQGGGTLHLFGFGYGHLPGPNRSLADLTRAALATDWPALSLPDGVTGPAACVAALAAALDAGDAAALGARVARRFALCPRLIPQAIRSAVATALQERARATVAAQALDALSAPLGGGLTVRHPDRAVAALAAALRFGVPRAALEAGEAEALARRGLAADAPAAARLVALAPQAVARRILKDAVMAAHPLLHAVGAATDAGLRVRMHSLAARSPTDLTRYEAGTLLLVLGVEDDRGAWWRREGLTPRGSAAPGA